MIISMLFPLRSKHPCILFIKMQSAKHLLRKEIKAKLKLLSEQEKLRQSQLVVKKLLNNPVYCQSQHISVYLHMKNEVQTVGILEDALKHDKAVYIPKYVGDNMDMVKLDSLQDYYQLPETSWHIKQPLEEDNSREKAMDSGGLDLIVVPGVGFTKAGDRLGHGKGYYDSYIEKVSKLKRPYLIGLAFDVQICNTIPITDHDKSLDEVLSVP